MKKSRKKRLVKKTQLRKVPKPRRLKKKKAKRHFPRKGRFWVYIVECSDGTYYTGYTPCLAKRIELHNKGKGAKYTRYRRPVRLIWNREYKYFKYAFLEEKRIKTFTRGEKEQLIKNKERLPKRRLNPS